MKIKVHSILVLSLCLMFLLSACGSIPAGTIKGTLVDGDGKPVSDISLQLIKVTDQKGEELTLEVSQYKVVTNEQGAFVFEKVESSKYVIMDLNISFPLGGNPPSLEEMVLRGKDGKVLIFEVPESKGLDLGDLSIPK